MTELTIAVDRAALALPPLVMLGHGETPGLAVSDYQEPALQARVAYAPDSPHVHGSMPLAAAWQQTLLGFNVFPDRAATEAQARGWVAGLVAALMQFRYAVDVTVAGAPTERWICHPGTIAPVGGRTRVDLEDHNPVYAVTIPCQPIRQVV